MEELKKFRELYKEMFEQRKKIITDDSINRIFNKFHSKSIYDLLDDKGNVKDEVEVKVDIYRKLYDGKSEKIGTNSKVVKVSGDDKDIIEKYIAFKLPVEEEAEKLINKHPEFKDLIKAKNGKFKQYNRLMDDIAKYIENQEQKQREDKEQMQLKYDDQEIKHDKEKQKNKEILESLTKQGSEVVDKQNKENAKLWQALEELGLNHDEIKGMLEEVKTRYTDLKKETDKAAMDKKFSKALKDLIRDKASESDISTVPKESLKERLIKNHSDLIHNEKEAEASADAIYRAALNKKVQYNKNSRYLYQFYEDFPQYVNLLPEEQQEVINKEIQRRYTQQQRQKILHYMLPKERPKWEKATVEHNINPQLGRRTYG